MRKVIIISSLKQYAVAGASLQDTTVLPVDIIPLTNATATAYEATGSSQEQAAKALVTGLPLLFEIVLNDGTSIKAAGPVGAYQDLVHLLSMSGGNSKPSIKTRLSNVGKNAAKAVGATNKCCGQ